MTVREQGLRNATKILAHVSVATGVAGAMSALAAVGICCNHVKTFGHSAEEPCAPPYPSHFPATTFWPFAGALLMHLNHFIACMLAEGFRAAANSEYVACWPVPSLLPP